MNKTTIGIIAILSIILASSGFTYWSSNKVESKAYQYIHQVDLSLYNHRGVSNSSPVESVEKSIDNEIALIDKQFQEGDKIKALAHYNSLLKKDPGNVEILLRIGIIYLQKNEYALAQENLSTVYEYKESIFTLDAAWFLALLNIEYGNMDTAKQLLEEVVNNRGNYLKNAKDLLNNFA